MLELNAITKDYPVGEGKVRALKGVDLKFRDTEFVSILGQSGCGKTTLLNIIGGLDRYTSGDLIIDGISTKVYKDVDWDAYRNLRIGFVFQSYNLISHMTILDNVAMALTLSGVGRAERNRRAREALAKVGLAEQVKKLPNQLSGGQMQRVSIARALINDPEIILADEPTGALDSATSVQVMELLKEISKTKLIVMVTHNAELAEQYSTRIVRLKDGEVIGDSDPYDGSDAAAKEPDLTEKEKKKKLKKTSMSFATAIKLSFSNLMTKKGRTIMTSIAGSIGIIGVSLVLAISNGFTSYVTRLQTDVLSGYPIQIASSPIDTNAFLSMITGATGGGNRQEFPDEDVIYGYDSTDLVSNLFIENDFGEDYINYVSEVEDKGWASGIAYGYGMNMTVVGEIAVGNVGREYVRVNPVAEGIDFSDLFSKGLDFSGLRSNTPDVGWYQLVGGEEFIMSQYDMIAGDKFPTEPGEAVLVVDQYNQANYEVLLGLGFSVNECRQVGFDDVIGKRLTVADNSLVYSDNGDGTFTKNESNDFYRNCYENGGEGTIDVEIVAVLRLKEDVMLGVLNQGVNYTPALTEYMLERNASAPVTLAQAENTDTNITTGEAFDQTNTHKAFMFDRPNTHKAFMQELGGDTTPVSMNIYPVDFENRQNIIEYLDAWNDEHPDEEVIYTDMSETATSMMNEIIRIISIVLICFAAISLVVSSVMIGIITYVSVVERTKEIGVLRSLGARKTDIYNVFNAESFIVGLFAGIIGVVITYILQEPINLIIRSLANMNGLNLCSFNPLHALLMVVISFCLTLIAGLVPSSVAAKKDPVVALRTE